VGLRGDLDTVEKNLTPTGNRIPYPDKVIPTPELADMGLIRCSDDRPCGLVVRVLGYRSGGPGSIPGTTRKKKSSGSGTGSTQPREYN
jgi:hypothetical protein